MSAPNNIELPDEHELLSVEVKKLFDLKDKINENPTYISFYNNRVKLYTKKKSDYIGVSFLPVEYIVLEVMDVKYYAYTNDEFLKHLKVLAEIFEEEKGYYQTLLNGFE